MHDKLICKKIITFFVTFKHSLLLGVFTKSFLAFFCTFMDGFLNFRFLTSFLAFGKGDHV